MSGLSGVACTAASMYTMALTSSRVWPGWLTLAAAASETATSSAAADMAADGAMRARGKALFRADCAACHQESGQGEARSLLRVSKQLFTCKWADIRCQKEHER